MASLNVLEQATGFGAMYYDAIFNSSEIDRDDIGLSLVHEAHMADQSFIENLINGLTVILSALGETFDAIALGPGEIGHEVSFVFCSILQHWLSHDYSGSIILFCNLSLTLGHSATTMEKRAESLGMVSAAIR
jgi:hypothetical protein